MNMHPTGLAFAFTAALLTLGRSGLCTEREPEAGSKKGVTAAAPATTAIAATDSGGYGYIFNDELVTGDGLSGWSPRLHVLRHDFRNLLIRPRTAFIDELCKSVETL